MRPQSPRFFPLARSSPALVDPAQIDAGPPFGLHAHRAKAGKLVFEFLDHSACPALVGRQDHQADGDEQHALQDWQKQAEHA